MNLSGKSVMIETPFDKVARKLLEINLSKKNRGTILVEQFVEICRVCYLQMIAASKPVWRIRDEIEAKVKQGIKTESVSLEEMLQNNIQSLNPNICYFQFIEYLNRYGRVFEKNKIDIKIPRYYRIRFYRNKAIEHWEDYSSSLFRAISGYYFTIGKIAVPYHFGTYYIPTRQKETFNKLLAELAVTYDFPPFEEIGNPEARSDTLFKLLERKYDYNLSTCDNKIVNLLFELGFPLPIHDVENYIKYLILELDTVISAISN